MSRVYVSTGICFMLASCCLVVAAHDGTVINNNASHNESSGVAREFRKTAKEVEKDDERNERDQFAQTVISQVAQIVQSSAFIAQQNTKPSKPKDQEMVAQHIGLAVAALGTMIYACHEYGRSVTILDGVVELISEQDEQILS